MLTLKHSPLNINNSLSRPYLHSSLPCRPKSRALRNSSQFNSVTNLNKFTVTASHSILAQVTAKNQGVRNITSYISNIKIFDNGIKGYRRSGPCRDRIDEKTMTQKRLKPYVLTTHSNPYVLMTHSNRYVFMTHSNRYVFMTHSNRYLFMTHSNRCLFMTHSNRCLLTTHSNNIRFLSLIDSNNIRFLLVINNTDNLPTHYHYHITITFAPKIFERGTTRP